MVKYNEKDELLDFSSGDVQEPPHVVTELDPRTLGITVLITPAHNDLDSDLLDFSDAVPMYGGDDLLDLSTPDPKYTKDDLLDFDNSE